MIIAEYSKKTNLSAEIIWNKWSDVSGWKKWDKEIEYSDLDGPFDDESTGIIKVNGGPITVFMLKDVCPLQKFVETSRLAIGEIQFHHHIEKVGRSTKITHKVELIGPMAIFFSFFLKDRLNLALEKAVKSLVNQAEYENKNTTTKRMENYEL